MPQVIPLASRPSQILNVNLNGQDVSLKVYQKNIGLFCDIYVGNVLLLGGVLCLNNRQMIINAYFGFDGDMAFFDTQGTDNPDYTGLGGRYMLTYQTDAEIAAQQ